MIQLFNANLFDKVKELGDGSIDLVLTDFPYGISFMGKAWDKTEDDFFYKVGVELFPKMKPGSFLVTTFTPRQDMLWRCLAGLERAGFTMKTSPIFWLYHSGFPKAMDISKVIDKSIGVTREKGKIRTDGRGKWELKMQREKGDTGVGHADGSKRIYQEELPTSDLAKEWAGWKSYQLKPSVEVIITVQKPLVEKTIVGQVLSNGHGAVNIEGTRIPYANEKVPRMNVAYEYKADNNFGGGHDARTGTSQVSQDNSQGRFPANLIVQGDPLIGKKTTSAGVGGRMNHGRGEGYGFKPLEEKGPTLQTDEGSPNRFYSLDAWAQKNDITLSKDSAFIAVPKPSNSEKNQNLEDVEGVKVNDGLASVVDNAFLRGETLRKNTHVSVKPTTLYCYLLKMFGRKDWIVLDPFMGSGTTGIACSKMGMNFIGIEKEKEYFEIAEKRLTPHKEQTTLEVF